MNTASTSWQDNCSTITSALNHMLNHEIIVDTVFKKDKISCLYAHKLVLSVWSSKFADWIMEREKNQMFCITFEEDVDVLKFIIQYLYSPNDGNCFLKLSMDKLIQTLEVSERFGINHINKKCLSSLRRKKVNPSNVIDYFDYGLRKNLNFIVRKCVKVFENEGINVEYMKENCLANSLINLLSLNKIALNSEADLLSLAISWLSYPANRHYKPHVLSFIDLQSINWTEYQDICRRYPHYFSDAELSSIILSQLRQDPTILPKWYKPKVKSMVENTCSLCIHIRHRIKISMPFEIMKINKRKDMKVISQEFGFQYQQFNQIKLLNIKLSFGPHQISPKEFSLQFSLGRSVTVKGYSISPTKRCDKYKIFFKSPLILKSKDTLTLKFNFHRGLLANNVHVVWPLNVQQQKLNSESDHDVLKVNMSSSKLAFYLSEDNSEKFIISSFYLKVCDNHFTYLSRKRLESENISSLMDLAREFGDDSKEVSVKNHLKEEITDMKMETDSELKNTSEEAFRKIHIKEEITDSKMGMNLEFKNSSEGAFGKVHDKDKLIDTKMDIDDYQQNYDSDVTLKDLKTSIKTEEITLDTSIEKKHSSFQIVSYVDLIDLTSEL